MCAQSVNSVVHVEEASQESEQLSVSSGNSVVQEVAISKSVDPSEVLHESSLESKTCSEANVPHEILPDPSCEPAQKLHRELGSDLRDCKSPVIIEIFCGSARVTASLRTLGLSSLFGVDHIKMNSEGPIKIADLITKKGQRILMKWLESPLVQGVFLAPSCGTCSLARNIKLRDSKGRVMPGPAPLRCGHPFPRKAFQIYHPPIEFVCPKRTNDMNLLAKSFGSHMQKGLIIVVENPRSSLFWMTRWWRLRGIPTFYVAYQACAYGSSRPKWAVLESNCKVFRKICRTCPGESATHKHLALGRCPRRTRNTFCNFRRNSISASASCRNCVAFRRSFEVKRLEPPCRDTLLGPDCVLGQMQSSHRSSSKVIKAATTRS